MKKIAILAPKKDFFGATIVQFPFYQSLRNAYPDAEIKVWSSVKSNLIFKKYQICNEVTDVEKMGFFSFFKSLFKFSPDLVINMRPYSLKTKIIVSMVPSKKKIQFCKKKKGKDVFQNTNIYIAFSYLDLLKPLKIDLDTNFNGFNKLIATSNFKISKERKNISLVVAGGELYKRWGIENFIALAKILNPEHSCFHFVLGKNETVYVDAINSSQLPFYEIHEERSIEDLGKLFQDSALVISNDCGPAHVAQLSKCNYLGIWGWGEKPLFPRFGEWHFPHDKSNVIMSPFNEPIANLKPENVAKICRGVLGI
jgi:ADP-heptose:LPS heptosyltransferase